MTLGRAQLVAPEGGSGVAAPRFRRAAYQLRSMHDLSVPDAGKSRLRPRRREDRQGQRPWHRHGRGVSARDGACRGGPRQDAAHDQLAQVRRLVRRRQGAAEGGRDRHQVLVPAAERGSRGARPPEQADRRHARPARRARERPEAERHQLFSAAPAGRGGGRPRVAALHIPRLRARGAEDIARAGKAHPREDHRVELHGPAGQGPFQREAVRIAQDAGRHAPRGHRGHPGAA